jgi:hypothetical protein
MSRKTILFIGGSLNQTRMGHKIAQQLQGEYDCAFTPYFGDGLYRWLTQWGWLDFTVLGGNFRRQTEQYLVENNLLMDWCGQQRDYDLYVTGSDLLVQKNVRNKKVVLVQEGMTDPENFMFYLVKWFKLPRYLASTATNGLSNQFDYFCVASEGYRDLFIRKGVRPEKIVVTGIPNFDNEARHRNNDFPHKNYVLVATSDARETFKPDNRRKFLKKCVAIANGRFLIFKLHPNEKVERAIREIKEVAPDALIFSEGPIEPMIANCDVLITQYSTVVYTGLALGKEVHSYFDVATLRRLAPIQNGGKSARNIADVCRALLESKPAYLKQGVTYATAD